MSSPVISIIIPIFNQARYLERCLKSIFNQSVRDFEVIIVDDGSTDDLKSVIDQYRRQIQLISQENKGAPAARNRGFQASSGEYVIFCDADSVLEPTMLEEMVGALMSNPEAAYAYSSFKFGWKKFRLEPFDEKKLKQAPYIHSNSLIRRKFFPAGGWDENLKKFQDWDLWLTILENGGRGVWLDKCLFKIAGQGTMSKWRPRFFYHLPFLAGSAIEDYQYWRGVIRNKHHLI